MATMMPPNVFNAMTSSNSSPSFRNGPPPPSMFNPNLPPPPNFNNNNIGNSNGMMRKPDNNNFDLGPPSTTPMNASPMQPGMGFQQRMYRFKPTATVNLAEAEGYGRRLRRNMAQIRRHIDGVASVLNYLEDRVWQNGQTWDQRAIQPHMLYAMEAAPPHPYLDKPVDCVTTKFVRSAMNKVKCPVYDVCWTPEGRRLVTGASSGEFTLWNGTAFNFETILQAHDTAIRAIKWSHNDQWMLSADHDGFIKYWQANMNNVTMFQAHKEAVRSVSFCPSDTKFATASDDGTVRVWDFMRCHEERILRGHGSDVRCVDWHPRKALLVSGSRDSQQPVKLWDPRTALCLATLHDHKNAVMAAQWNENGNWLVTGSRDHLVKLYDIRMMKEMMTFRGHKKEVTSLAWHPIHEGLLVSGGADGALMFWMANNDKEIGVMEQAHEQAIWTLKWHPLGHILASGANDNNTKFWTRNKAGDSIEDFYFVGANPYEHPAQQRIQVSAITAQVPVQPATTSAAAVGDRPNWDAATTDSTAAATSSTAPSSTVSKVAESRKSIGGGGIPGMGLEGDLFEKLREQQYQSNAISVGGQSQSSSSQLQDGGGGIPGLGGLPETNETGGRKTLLKQPPPKKAQRQFERVWNVNSSRMPGGSSMMGGGGPGDDDRGGMSEMDFRKPKPSLLGAPPPVDMAPLPAPAPPPQSLLSGPAQGQGLSSLSSSSGIPSLLANVTSSSGPWMDPPSASNDIWQQPPAGLFQQQQQQQSAHFSRQQPQTPSFLSSLHTDPKDSTRGGGTNWFEDVEHGDVDFRQKSGGGGGGGGGWLGGGSGGQYDDADFRDALPGLGGGSSSTSRSSASNIRDPRMQPRTQSSTEQQQSQDQPQTDYRFQNWLERNPSSGGGAGGSLLDRRAASAAAADSSRSSSMDPRRSTNHPQSLLTMTLQPPSNGGGGGILNSNSRSRSDDQDSDQELYGIGDGSLSGGGGGRNAGAPGTPTNPKRKWKQEYEAEEAQGTTKRWALSPHEDSPESSFILPPPTSSSTSSTTNDRDERQIWARQPPNSQTNRR